MLEISREHNNKQNRYYFLFSSWVQNFGAEGLALLLSLLRKLQEEKDEYP